MDKKSAYSQLNCTISIVHIILIKKNNTASQEEHASNLLKDLFQVGDKLGKERHTVQLP